MKKKLLIGAVVALFLGAGVFTATSLAAKEQISDLTLANIEAMSIGIGVEYDRVKVEAGCDGKTSATCEVSVDGVLMKGTGNPYYRRIETGVGGHLGL